METRSDRVFEAQVPAEWVYRKIDMDYGLDREIEIVEAENLTGKKILVQLKSSDSVELTEQGIIKFPLETDKLGYYASNDLPVMLVLVDLRTNSCYWLFVHEYVEKLRTTKPSWSQQRTITLEIPATNIWEQSIDTIRKIAFDGPTIILLKKLSISPGKFLAGIPSEQLEPFLDHVRDLSFASVYRQNVESKIKWAPGVEANYIVRAYVWSAGQPNLGIFGSQSAIHQPVGTILTRSTGDLVFVVTTTHPFSDILSQIGISRSSSVLGMLGVSDKVERYDTIVIYLPPGFTLPTLDGSTVVTTTTDGDAQAFRVSPVDIYAPGWTAVCVTLDQSHQSHNVRTFDRDYCVRLRHVTAPGLAGKYFFKIALLNRNGQGVSQSDAFMVNSTELSVKRSDFVRSDNWPILFVKGELFPAVITGTIRYGDNAQPSLRGEPIREAGCVYAHMETVIDPYTRQEIGRCPEMGQPMVSGCKDAVAYFTASSKGQYELYGVAPGVYTIYAQAAGFPTSVIAHRVRVLGGTSHQFDGHLQPGQVISGNVSPKSQNGDYRWLNSTPINIEFFTSPTLQFTPDPYARAISWSPQTVAKQQNIASGKRSQLDVGPPQDWAVQEGQTIPFHFEFGVRGEYGAPRDFDGRVPQVYATWVNGLTPGRYYVRAWAEDHVQSAKDGSFQEYYFDVAPNETGADIPLRIELRKSGLQR